MNDKKQKQTLFIQMVHNTFIYNNKHKCHMVKMTSLMLLKSRFSQTTVNIVYCVADKNNI